MTSSMANIADHEKTSAVLRTITGAWEGKVLRLLPDEQISFGKSNNHNPYADISFSNGAFPGIGLRASSKGLKENMVVLTLWSESGHIVPGIVNHADKRFTLELLESQEEGDRCFVLDEVTNSFVTVSSFYDGGKIVRVVPPVAMDSWLLSVGSKCVRHSDGRFEVIRDGDSFVIIDAHKKRKFSGTLKGSKDDFSAEHEVAMIRKFIATRGLGAIVPVYGLKRSKEQEKA